MDRASEHFTQAITLDPSAVLPLYSLAQAHLHRRMRSVFVEFNNPLN